MEVRGFEIPLRIILCLIGVSELVSSALEMKSCKILIWPTSIPKPGPGWIQGFTADPSPKRTHNGKQYNFVIFSKLHGKYSEKVRDSISFCNQQLTS